MVDLSIQSTDSSLTIRRFGTQEELIGSFAQETRIPIPRMTGGPGQFFADLGQWAATYAHFPPESSLCAAIPPDPSMGLAYPHPADELTAALATVGKPASKSLIEECAEEFGLCPDLLSRPTVALSGGERLLLNYAKAAIIAPIARRLVVCSPLQWLSPANYFYLDRLLSRYKNNGQKITLMALDGERIFRNELKGRESESDLSELKLIPWSIELRNAVVSYPGRRFPIESAERTIHFKSRNEQVKLDSPTLCEGSNGIGKSTFARCLCQCETAAAGSFRVRSGSFDGPARLLMSYADDQLFGISPREHINWIFRCDHHAKKEAIKLFSDMQDDVATFLGNNPECGSIGNRLDPTTLLQAKLALVAERLLAKPSLIILDEPGWGLSRSFAAAFFRSVCMRASSQGTAVLVIAHTNAAYRPLLNSRLHFARDVNDPNIVWIDDLDSVPSFE